MRLLHTADWHLGRSFHGEGLLDAQAAAVDHVVDVARESAVDVVVVAGDLYDRALPPVDAVRLADAALARLSEVCPVVVISGNHDSPARLGFGARLFERSRVHVRTVPGACAEAVDVGGLRLYAVPYLEPDVVHAELEAPERTHAGVLGAAMARVRADVARRPAGARSVVVAHATVVGADGCASERELAVGGAGAVPASLFAGVDYVALGHLHGPQRVGTRGRYAGSPLAFSFSEARHRKSLAVVDLGGDEDGDGRVEPVVELVPFPVPRALAVLEGRLDALLSDPAHAGCEDAWVQATITDPVRPVDAMERLRRRFPHTAVLAFAPERGDDDVAGTYADRVRGLGDAELIAGFVAEMRGSPAEPAELGLVHDALSATRLTSVEG